MNDEYDKGGYKIVLRIIYEITRYTVLCTIGLAFISFNGLTNFNLRGRIFLDVMLSMSFCFECALILCCNACSDCVTTHEVDVVAAIL